MKPRRERTEEEKAISEYRSYLLKLGRVVAVREARRNHDLVTPQRIRSKTRERGELDKFLDDKWMTKVLSPKIFKQVAPNNWQVLEEVETPYKFPVWEGIRPTEDPIADAERRLLAKLATMDEPDWLCEYRDPIDPNPPVVELLPQIPLDWIDNRFNSSAWKAVQTEIVSTLGYLKSRGVRGPMKEFTHHMMRSSSQTSAKRTSKTVTFWLIDSLYYQDAYMRLKKDPPELTFNELNYLGRSETPKDALEYVRLMLKHRNLL